VNSPSNERKETWPRDPLCNVTSCSQPHQTQQGNSNQVVNLLTNRRRVVLSRDFLFNNDFSCWRSWCTLL